MSKEKIIREYELFDVKWPCCQSCDGWKCDTYDPKRRLQATIQIIAEDGDVHLRVIGEDAEEIKQVLGLY